ncbi:MAG: undecaprenyl-phosphate glucose phosphotransferase [Oligoflexales bacterium]
MSKSYSNQPFQIAFDTLLVIIAWICAYALRFHTHLPIPKGTPDFSHYLKLIPLVGISWGLILALSTLYQPKISIRKTHKEIIKSCFFATIFFLALTSFYHEFRYSRGALLFFVVLHPVTLMLWHSLQRKMLRKQKPQKTLVIASYERLKQLEDLFPKHEIDCVILLSGSQERIPYPTHKRPEHWLDFLSKYQYTNIVILTNHTDTETLQKDLPTLVDQTLDIKVIPDISEYRRFGVDIDIINHTPIIQLQACPLSGFNISIKRCVDLLGAVVALFIFSPVMILLSFLIPFSSRGPILYRQTRIGIDGETFEILKFRSMPISAEAQTGAIFATATDNRATWLGRFMRKTSLDELPQLLNVLLGDMSLVGPRPERPVFVDQFRREIPAYMLRHKVRAGMTGWAQINGWRGNTSIHKRIECDLYYIQNWSLWLDIKILFLTVFKGFISPQAY